MVGGIIPRSIASTVYTDSIAPAAPSVWPVIDFVGIEIAVFETHPHALGGAASIRRGRRNVVGVAVGGVTADLCDDLRAALDCGVALLEDKRRRSLRHHESIALLVEGTAGF